MEHTFSQGITDGWFKLTHISHATFGMECYGKITDDILRMRNFSNGTFYTLFATFLYTKKHKYKRNQVKTKQNICVKPFFCLSSFFLSITIDGGRLKKTSSDPPSMPKKRIQQKKIWEKGNRNVSRLFLFIYVCIRALRNDSSNCPNMYIG